MFLVYNDPCFPPTDIDECVIAALNGTDICNATMFCMNTMGGYTCECPGGTELVDGSCREISMLPLLDVFVLIISERILQ